MAPRLCEVDVYTVTTPECGEETTEMHDFQEGLHFARFCAHLLC